MISPIAGFMADACEFGPEEFHWIPKMTLYDAWCGYAKKHGMKQLTLPRFGQRFLALNPAVVARRRRHNGSMIGVYDGVKLTDEAARYLM